MMGLRSIRDLDLEGRSVFMRLDLNCPIQGGVVSSDARIRAAVPTIGYALEQGARVAIASHLGRPKGKAQPKFSMEPIGIRLSEVLNREMVLVDSCIGDGVNELMRNLRSGDVILLENLRFHAGETQNCSKFAKKLAAPFEYFVNDAFGACHREHASVVGVVPYVEQVAAGFLIESELEGLRRLGAKSEEGPFVAVIGGAKVSDKVGILLALLDQVQVLCIGGAMAYTFLRAQGEKIGASRVEVDKLNLARKIIAGADARDVKLLLPSDHVVASEFAPNASSQLITGTTIPDGQMGLDIGPDTQNRYGTVIKEAGTVLWNGPMGVCEWEPFAVGTNAVAGAVAQCGGYTVVGGGDSVAAVEKSGYAAQVNHVSTGGGASLEFLEKGNLPGLRVLGEH